MPTRKPASVLPDPVGAAMSVSRPAAMCAQPCAWAGVGPSPKRRANQVATAGWNPLSGRWEPRPAAGSGANSGSVSTVAMTATSVQTAYDNQGPEMDQAGGPTPALTYSDMDI